MGKLLLLGVSGVPAWRIKNYFDLGGPGTYLSEHPFDLEYLPLPSSKLISVYDLIGKVGKQTGHPFDLGTIAAWYSEHPFDLIADAPTPTVGVLPVPPPLLPGETPGTAPVFTPGIAVYTKGGVYVGSITLWSSIDSRSIAIGQSGGMQFGVPIRDYAGNPNAELDLIQLDRIIVVGNNLGTPAWAGTISSFDWDSEGNLMVACEDLSALMSNIEVGDRTGSVNPKDVPNPADAWAVAERAKLIVALSGERAASAVTAIIGQVNQWRARDAEVLWELDATGSNTFFGDENITGDALSSIGLLAERSFSEYCWGVRVSAGRMNPVFIWRDQFAGGAGAALHDGANGNMSVNIMYRETSTPIINAIRLTGSVTRIENEIPDGAQALPVAEIIPVAEVWLDPGPYRRRTALGLSAGIKLNVSVPFSFPADTQKALADAERAKLMALFRKYIAAIHDQLGQPYHSEGFNATGGWSWAGPTENVPETLDGEPYTAFGERHLTIADWTHHRFLAEGPSSVVMEKNDGTQRVRVTFDLLTGVQQVARNSKKSVEDPTKVYAFELRYLKNWDPRRDGVGEKRNVTTVAKGAVVKGDRWRVVSWNQTDQNVTTYLMGDRGLTPTDTVAYVVSTLAFPVPPFTAVIGGDETVLVTAVVVAGAFQIVRGQEGTQAILHEPGESFEYVAPASDSPASTDPEQLPPIRQPWPEGEAYARRLLLKLSRPERNLSLNVVNRTGEWSTISLGSTHSVNIQTAGRSGGIVVTGRVVAYAADELAGTMEVVLEVDLP